MKRIEVESTSLKSMAYDEEARVLEVEFVHGGVYRYYEVPIELYEALKTAESKGRFYQMKIRNNFAFERVKGRKQ